MSNRHFLLVPSLLALLAVACSSSSEPGKTPVDTGMVSDTGGLGDDTAETPDDTAGKPATPTISTVAKMGGNLHVTWKLNDTKLDNVELWRNKDASSYAKEYTLPGTATGQHDTGAVAPGKYCYQVYTVRAGIKSDPSPEKCGTP